MESSDDAIISKNLDGIILSWNAGAERLFAFSEAEAVGQPIAILIPEELRDEETKILQHLRAGGTFEHYETVRLTKYGKKLDVSLTLSPVRDSAGMVVGVSKIARDITARKRAEHVLRESEERFRLVANTAPVLIWMAATDRLVKLHGPIDGTGVGGWMALGCASRGQAALSRNLLRVV